jgi:hypothetical protein
MISADFAGLSKRVAFERTFRAGASLARLYLRWDTVAPAGSSAPAGFDPRNPSDPHYRWSAVDDVVRSAIDAGIQPILSVVAAPAWAQSGTKVRPTDGPVRPSPAALGDFATALATRFGGGFGGLPRVRYWQVWNEPNLSNYLMPQFDGVNAVSPEWYRSMVNAMSHAVHAVHSDNVVVAGGLAPFGGDSNDPIGGQIPPSERVHPLQFMREMLCMSGGSKPTATCSATSEFDVWAHHPYTYGGPTHSAFHPDDVSLGDLGEMRRLLEAASSAGHIQMQGALRFWVTEFSYDSKPADPKGLDPALHARWTSEALYRMWRNGVSLVAWFNLRDDAFPQQMFQSGLYLRGPTGLASDEPKPALRAFRFPFVAFRRETGAATYWGRTPGGVTKAVVVEQKVGSRWSLVGTPVVNSNGIFAGTVSQTPVNGVLRARFADRSDVSVPFSLRVPADFAFCPWGSNC